MLRTRARRASSRRRSTAPSTGTPRCTATGASYGWCASSRTAALAAGLTAEHLAAEAAYVAAPGRESFERPYGLAWLLELALELREWGSGPARPWLAALAPLESLAAARLAGWLPKLRWPVRSGEHAQTAFALGLALDWARGAGDRGLEALIVERALAWYGDDREAPIAYEPSGQDFLSPVLGEADLMRRVLEGERFQGWLEAFLPDVEGVHGSRALWPDSAGHEQCWTVVEGFLKANFPPAARPAAPK